MDPGKACCINLEENQGDIHEKANTASNSFWHAETSVKEQQRAIYSI